MNLSFAFGGWLVGSELFYSPTKLGESGFAKNIILKIS